MKYRKREITYGNFAILHGKNYHLFQVDENSLEQCCAANIVQCCQQYCSALLHMIQGQQYCSVCYEQREQHNIVVSCFYQP